jgi:hypothetical protein
MTKQSRATRIADLNDKFRRNPVPGGRTYMTPGVNAKGPEFVSKALARSPSTTSTRITIRTASTTLARSSSRARSICGRSIISIWPASSGEKIRPAPRRRYAFSLSCSPRSTDLLLAAPCSPRGAFSALLPAHAS